MFINIVRPVGSGWTIGVDLLGNSSTVSGRSCPEGRWAGAIVSFGTSYFRARFTSFHAHASLIFYYFSVLFHSYCSYEQVFGKHSCMSSSFPIVILNDTSFFSDSATASVQKRIGARWRHSQCTSNPVSTKLNLLNEFHWIFPYLIKCLNIMFITIVINNRRMTVEAARKSREPWGICNWMGFTWPFLLGPVFFWPPSRALVVITRSGVWCDWGNCKKGARRRCRKSRRRCRVYGLSGVCLLIVCMLSDLTWLPLLGGGRKS